MAESRIKDGNFIVVQSFMVKDLKLKGNELFVYAIIYGFSQAENQVFDGSLQYLADWVNGTKQGVMKNLKSLEERGHIGKNEKYINGVKFCEYYATKFNTLLNKVEGGIQQSLTEGMKQSLPNNISSNKTVNNIEDKKEERKKESYDSIIAETSFNEEVKQIIKEFIKMRKLINKPMTDYALKKMLNKLNRLSTDPQTQIKILDKSITNNWQDIYELKEDEKPVKDYSQSEFNKLNQNEESEDFEKELEAYNKWAKEQDEKLKRAKGIS